VAVETGGCDVAIVGGGPAGATAAAVLARAGVRTLLLEHSSGTSFKVGWHLDRVRVDARLRDLAHDAGARVELTTAARQIARTAEDWQLTIARGERPASVTCQWLVDCSSRRAPAGMLSVPPLRSRRGRPPPVTDGRHVLTVAANVPMMLG
jgi:flavin-dependent dehydrogenase